MSSGHNIQISTPESCQNVRLDKFLAERYPERSRSYWQNHIRAGKVSINGKLVKVNYVLKCGDMVVMEKPASEPHELQPESISLSIVYSDKDIVVINKPPGMVVHPAAGNREHTLVNALLHHFPDLEISGHRERPGIVHRLDKDTSGLMVIARNLITYQKLVEQISSRHVKRKYYALVLGCPSPDCGTIGAPIGRHEQHRTKMAVNLINGKEAITHYKTHECFLLFSLLDLALETGRTHQIRVHLSHIGYPIIGDRTYGVCGNKLHSLLAGKCESRLNDALSNIERQMLHAYYLEFRHPATGEIVSFSAELAPDFRGILDLIRVHYGKE